MKQSQRIRRVVVLVLVSVITIQLTACGYLFWPERRNQTADRDIDPTVAILDGLGLLVFIIPGVIAFIVDFTTHTIYLPPGRKATLDKPPQPEKMVAVKVPGHQLTKKGIESLVSQYVGEPVSIDPRTVKIHPLETKTSDRD